MKFQHTKQLLENKSKNVKLRWNIKWYKAYDFEDGESINDIKKLDINGNI